LLVFTKKKLRTRFRLVLQSTTLKTLNGHIAHSIAQTCIFRGPLRKVERYNVSKPLDASTHFLSILILL